jgi:hypothetical protein
MRGALNAYGVGPSLAPGPFPSGLLRLGDANLRSRVSSWKLTGAGAEVMLPLGRPTRQTFVALRNVEHFASGERIKYFRGNSSRVFSAIAPTLRIMKELLGHRRTSPVAAPRLTIVPAGHPFMNAE